MLLTTHSVPYRYDVQILHENVPGLKISSMGILKYVMIARNFLSAGGQFIFMCRNVAVTCRFE
jgi:hypothetical protein